MFPLDLIPGSRQFAPDEELTLQRRSSPLRQEARQEIVSCESLRKSNKEK